MSAFDMSKFDKGASCDIEINVNRICTQALKPVMEAAVDALQGVRRLGPDKAGRVLNLTPGAFAVKAKFENPSLKKKFTAQVNPKANPKANPREATLEVTRHGVCLRGHFATRGARRADVKESSIVLKTPEEARAAVMRWVADQGAEFDAAYLLDKATRQPKPPV